MSDDPVNADLCSAEIQKANIQNAKSDGIEIKSASSDGCSAGSHEATHGEIGKAILNESPVEPDGGSTHTPKSIHAMTLMLEGGMFVLAIACGWLLSFHDPNQPLSNIADWPWAWSILWGTLASLPIFFMAWMLPRAGWKWSSDFSSKVEKLLRPIFGGISILGLAWIALWAGIGEEFLFRWFLQGGLTRILQFQGGVIVALIIASTVFGLLHWINRTYAILATIIGFYFGGLMILSGTVLVPLVAHAVYDFLALVWLTRKYTDDH